MLSDEDIEKAVEHIAGFLAADAKIEYEFIVGGYDFLYTETLPPMQTESDYLAKRYRFKVFYLCTKSTDYLFDLDIPYYAGKTTIEKAIVKAVEKHG